MKQDFLRAKPKPSAATKLGIKISFLNPAERPAPCQISVLLKTLVGSLMLMWAILNPAAAATLPNGFTETLVASGLANPTAMEFAPDGRLFVCLQGGQLKVIKNGSLLATPFLTVTSNPAYLHISSNNPPIATIKSPTNGTLYTAGDTIQYRGTATDAEDGTPPPSAFSWTIVFHHGTHTHPFLGPLNGVTNGSFVITTQGETAANVWYRINLTVTDSLGQTNASYVNVVPRTSTVSLATSPAALQVTLDGQPVTSPVSVSGVVGMNRTLGGISPQTLNGTNYTFTSWSDGGAVTHDFSWPPAATTYTATYQVVPAVASRIESLIVSPDGQVRLTLRAPAGQTFMFQASTNFGSWNDLGSVTISGESAEFVDSGATNRPYRYYRAKRF